MLGYWLLSNRSRIREEREPDYDCSPIDRQIIRYADLAPQLVRLIHQKRGRVCVIGPKARSLPTGIETILVKNNFRVLEPMIFLNYVP